mgnify:CR=1 FL=1
MRPIRPMCSFVPIPLFALFLVAGCGGTGDLAGPGDPASAQADAVRALEDKTGAESGHSHGRHHYTSNRMTPSESAPSAR